MKRLLIGLIAISLLVSCRDKRPKVDRVFQDGVEIVLNHVEPYRVPGEPSVLSLEREFSIDAEDPELLQAGLTDIFRFGVGTDGSIYIAQRPRKDVPIVFKFDRTGHLEVPLGGAARDPARLNAAPISALSAATRYIF
ncbi:MAG: hypothetical protein MZV70_69295 [Desulfobacterales bacterium]|nr:hypothetical protein [Desulfobacterales bacterium]